MNLVKELYAAQKAYKYCLLVVKTFLRVKKTGTIQCIIIINRNKNYEAWEEWRNSHGWFPNYGSLCQKHQSYQQMFTTMTGDNDDLINAQHTFSTTWICAQWVINKVKMTTKHQHKTKIKNKAHICLYDWHILPLIL